MEKIAPKNNSIYQEFIGLYGTFAIPEKQGLIIDKSGHRTMKGVLQQAQDKLATKLNQSY